MQPMQLCILLCKCFGNTFENTQWRKVKQVQPMRLCLFVCKPFEDTFEDAQWRKTKQMQCDYASSCVDGLRGHLKTHGGEKSHLSYTWKGLNPLNTATLYILKNI